MKLVRAWLVPFTLLAVGIIIGSWWLHMGWLPSGTAGLSDSQPIVRPWPPRHSCRWQGGGKLR
jgi:hypothetical protein